MDMNSSEPRRRFTDVRAFGVAALVFVAAGCVAPAPSSPSAPALPNAPAEVADRAPLPHCGIENATHNSGFNVDGRACFWNAYQSRSPAEFITTQPTTHGDPITTVYRIEVAGRIVVYVDTTSLGRCAPSERVTAIA